MHENQHEKLREKLHEKLHENQHEEQHEKLHEKQHENQQDKQHVNQYVKQHQLKVKLGRLARDVERARLCAEFYSLSEEERLAYKLPEGQQLEDSIGEDVDEMYTRLIGDKLFGLSRALRGSTS